MKKWGHIPKGEGGVHTVDESKFRRDLDRPENRTKTDVGAIAAKEFDQ